MKRVLFYFLLVLQALVLISFSVLYERIDEYGQTISIKTSEEFMSYSWHGQGQKMYMDYEINRINTNQFSNVNWNKMERNERVYVLLERKENGLFSVINASDKKLKSTNANEIVLKAKFQYMDSTSNEVYVHYGMEVISNQHPYDHLKPNVPWMITLQISPWGQKRVVSIENIEE